MSSFSIDMDDPREAWEALYREIEARACPDAPPGAPVTVRTTDRAVAVPADDLVGWLWLMHGCWVDDVS
ncbi:MAG: hypothetical protein IT386_00415 [Deltaproteobacteria bacterium]|nr:hypothetical protein [Deltaproteobacteria bacterium]